MIVCQPLLIMRNPSSLTDITLAEKALMSLPSPLTATDTFSMRRSNGLENVTLRAGLHRQVWVSGTSVFVDVCVENNSRKSVKKVELQLERAILCYKHVRHAPKSYSEFDHYSLIS